MDDLISPVSGPLACRMSPLESLWDRGTGWASHSTPSAVEFILTPETVSSKLREILG